MDHELGGNRLNWIAMHGSATSTTSHRHSRSCHSNSRKLGPPPSDSSRIVAEYRYETLIGRHS